MLFFRRKILQLLAFVESGISTFDAFLNIAAPTVMGKLSFAALFASFVLGINDIPLLLSFLIVYNRKKTDNLIITGLRLSL